MKTKFRSLGRPLAVAAAMTFLCSVNVYSQDVHRVEIGVRVLDFPATEPMLESFDVLELIELAALDARDGAATLKSFSMQPSAHSPESHAWKLNRISESVNDISDQLERLAAREEHLLPRQLLALAHIRSDLPILAANTENAIRFFNENGSERWHDDYETYVSAMYDTADGIVQAADMAERRVNVEEYLDNFNR